MDSVYSLYDVKRELEGVERSVNSAYAYWSKIAMMVTKMIDDEYFRIRDAVICGELTAEEAFEELKKSGFLDGLPQYQDE